MEHLKCIIFKNDLQQLTVISDLRKMIFQQTSHFNKRLIGNAENLINPAAFNRVNAVCLVARRFLKESGLLKVYISICLVLE